MGSKLNRIEWRRSPRAAIFAGIVAVAGMAWLVFRSIAPPTSTGSDLSREVQPESGVSPDSQSVPDAAVTATASAAFRLRPFAVAHSTETSEWTAENGKDTNVIRQFAHNELEYQRLVEENSRVLRRQLVYRKDTAAAVLQRARSSGERVTQLTLPGLDGQEFQFAIDRADLEPSQQAGSFTGHLAGRPDSLVTLAFKFGREAFTILSPEDGVCLQAHPREPGEVIITSFDPEDYQPVRGGEPIVTSQKQ